MRKAKHPHARRAFATGTALALIGIVGATLASIAVMFAGDVKRSVRQAEEAQLRQLLIAGEVAARNAIGTRAEGAQVKLPGQLTSSGLSLNYEEITANEDEGVRIRVTARAADGQSMTQTLSYVRDGNRWELHSAELN